MNQGNFVWNGDSDDENNDPDNREPGMWAGKRVFIFLIDVTEPMFEKDIDDKTYFVTCIEACKKIMLQKIFQQQNDLIGIVLYGTKHKGLSAQADHVTTLQDLAQPNADKIKELMTIVSDVDGFEKQHGHSYDFSFAEALWHCHRLVSNCTVKTYDKTIFLMTCTDNPHAADNKLQHAARERAGNLSQQGIKLEILSFGMTFNVDVFFKEVLESNGQDEIGTIKLMKSVEDILECVQHSPKKRSLCRVLWSLGEDVKIAVAAYSFLKSSSPFPKKIKMERSRNAEVKPSVQAFNTETGEEVIPAEISKAMKIGGQTIKFEAEELRNVKKISQPGLVLLGFKPVVRIEIWFQKRNSLFIYPEERKVVGSRTLFAALHERCLIRKMAAICYFTSRRSAKPALVALLPLAEKVEKDGTQHVPPGFLLRYLPYADNIRDLGAQEVKCPHPEPELVQVAESLINKIKFKYKPSIVENPKLQKHWSVIEALALGYEEPEEPFDQTLPNHDYINSKIETLAEDFMNMAFPGGFDEDVVKKAVKRAAPPKEPVAKKPKPDLENSSMEDIAKQGLVEKLTMDKLKQYLTMEGIKVTKMKKAELVEAVYHHLGIEP